jgi:hypothetical protein
MSLSPRLRSGITIWHKPLTHGPEPTFDVFIKLPWRQQLLGGSMAYHLLGFQTLRDRHNFLACADALLHVDVTDLQQPVVSVASDERRSRVGHYGISIDFDEFDQLASPPSVVEQVKTLRAITESVPNTTQGFTSVMHPVLGCRYDSRHDNQQYWYIWHKNCLLRSS